MATIAYLKLSNASNNHNLVMFAESSTGVFDKVLTEWNSELDAEIDSGPLRVVWSPTASGLYVRNSYYTISGLTITNYGLWTYAQSSSVYNLRNYPYYVTEGGSKTSAVKVIDEHGTNIGIASEGSYVANTHFGILHKTTEIGWKFVGYKFRFTNNYTLTSSIFLSNQTVENGTDYYEKIVRADYTGAVVFKLGGYRNLEITALYEEAQKITITADYDYSGSTPITVELYEDETLDSIPIPFREGYVFESWSSSKYGTTLITRASSEYTTIYARWRLKDYREMLVEYDLAGGENGPTSTYIMKETEYTIPDTIPTKDGYTFTGWKVGDDEEIRQPGYTFTITEAITITAQWEENVGPEPPPTPTPGTRPDSQKDYMVYGTSGVLSFSNNGGHLVYAI